MSWVEKLNQSHEKSMKTIKSFLEPDSGMPKLAQWLLENDANPYSYLPEPWANCTYSSSGFAALLHYIHHAVIDDGSISFITVNEEPRIVFNHPSNYATREQFKSACLSDTEKWRLGRNMGVDIKILRIDHEDFPEYYDNWFKNWIKQCFLDESDPNTAAIHYRKYKLWDESWLQEANNGTL